MYVKVHLIDTYQSSSIEMPYDEQYFRVYVYGACLHVHTELAFTGFSTVSVICSECSSLSPQHMRP
jgi:hypothetical protein